MKKSDFWFDLPQEQIAQTPIEPRDHSRMLVMDRTSGQCSHRHFYDILDYLQGTFSLPLGCRLRIMERSINALPSIS